MYVVTPRCAAAVFSAVVLRRNNTHPYSMMPRRLTTAGIEVVPRYHQLLVVYTFSTYNIHAKTPPKKRLQECMEFHLKIYTKLAKNQQLPKRKRLHRPKSDLIIVYIFPIFLQC